MNYFIDSIKVEEKNFKKDKLILEKEMLNINNDYKLTLK